VPWANQIKGKHLELNLVFEKKQLACMDLSPYPLPDTFEDVDVPKAFPGWVVGPM